MQAKYYKIKKAENKVIIFTKVFLSRTTLQGIDKNLSIEK